MTEEFSAEKEARAAYEATLVDKPIGHPSWEELPDDFKAGLIDHVRVMHLKSLQGPSL